jgi:hypothetical protein
MEVASTARMRVGHEPGMLGAPVLNEQHYLTRYNSAIARVKLCQGTLLDDYGVVVSAFHSKVPNLVVRLSAEHTD